MASPTDTSCAKSGLEITPHATDRFQPCRAVYVGVGGDVNVVWPSGETSIMKGAPTGQERPWGIIGVLVVGTTATDLVALY